MLDPLLILKRAHQRATSSAGRRILLSAAFYAAEGFELKANYNNEHPFYCRHCGSGSTPCPHWAFVNWGVEVDRVM